MVKEEDIVRWGTTSCIYIPISLLSIKFGRSTAHDKHVRKDGIRFEAVVMVRKLGWLT